MDPTDPPGDGHPLPPANEWEPEPETLAILTEPIIGSISFPGGKAVIVASAPDADGQVVIRAIGCGTAVVPADKLIPDDPAGAE